MTTIITMGAHIIADTGVWQGETRGFAAVSKLRWLEPSKTFVAASGSLGVCERFFRWCENQHGVPLNWSPPPEPLPQAVFVDRARPSTLLLDSGNVIYGIPMKYDAIGSGREIAMGAMHVAARQWPDDPSRCLVEAMRACAATAVYTSAPFDLTGRDGEVIRIDE